MAPVSYRTVEFHRFGPPEDILMPKNCYIRTCGWGEAAGELSPRLDYEVFEESLNALRYSSGASDSEVNEALERFSGEANHFLAKIQPEDGRLLQLDLVTNAAELWALPFEACFKDHPLWLEQPDRGVVITRRIRGDFSETATTWPVVPRVLFVHAPVAGDLDQKFIDTHAEALDAALQPWLRGPKSLEKLPAEKEKWPTVKGKLLAVKEVKSPEDLAQARLDFKPTHVHILAHGAKTRGNPLSRKVIWGPRLGAPGQPGASPSEVADALKPDAGLPVVVTLGVCDSGNQDAPMIAKTSVVQELHRCGVPVVIGSQLPLTQPGSTRLTKTFYERLLLGEDVRVALHAARVELNRAKDAGHDWMSVVSYVRLPPEGYAEYLENVALKVELRLLEATRERARALMEGGMVETVGSVGTVDEFGRVENELRARLESLSHRRDYSSRRIDYFEESRGLEASAYKRYAELLLYRGLRHEDVRDSDWKASREQLRLALAAYRAAFDEAPRSHWLGIQQLALEAVLTGKVTRPEDWLIVARTAEIARDRPSKSGESADYWSCGTLLELQLLAPLAGQRRDAGKVEAAASLLVERARAVGDEFAIDTTRRQIERYTWWWTNDHGFFPGVKDLAAVAGELRERSKLKSVC